MPEEDILDIRLRQVVGLRFRPVGDAESGCSGTGDRRLAQVLQFTLPGSPNLYYGSEVGMTGGDDPEMRAPMRWDLVSSDNPELVWIKQLIALRKENRALRIGNFRLIEAERILAFERYTERALATLAVIINLVDFDIVELTRISHQM